MVPVYVVASVVLLLFAFVGGMDNIESIQSGMSMYNDDYVYRKSIYEVGLSVFVWIGLILAIIFESKWKKRKNIMIIGPLLQINAIFTAVAIPCEEFYLRYFDPERVWDIGGIVSEVFLGIICIYIFGGVAYTIAVCLKNRKQ